MSGEDENQTEPKFKVVDRRRFSATGDVRPEALHVKEPEKPPVPKEAQDKLKGRDHGQDGGIGQGSQPGSASSPNKARGGDFLGFVAQLATNAMAALGVLPEAQSRGMPVNPQMAMEYINIIAMLEERTTGNLSPEEEGALKRLLAELRLQYIETTEGPMDMPGMPGMPGGMPGMPGGMPGMPGRMPGGVPGMPGGMPPGMRPRR